jgi:hypothetical protein
MTTRKRYAQMQNTCPTKLATITLVVVAINLAWACSDSKSEMKKKGAAMPSANTQEFDDLLREFAGTIKTGRVEGDLVAAVDRMDALLKRWDPTDKPVYQLKALLGPPSSETQNELVYRMSTGLADPMWRFAIDGNRIASWRLVPGR